MKKDFRSREEKPCRGMRWDEHGFTLIELLVVMVILGLLATLVVPRLFGTVEQSKVTATRAQIERLGTALALYRLDVGRYPERMEDLLSSNEQSWNGPYLKKNLSPQDPWGDEYQYEVLDDGREYHLSSGGGGDEPIQSWE